MTHSPERTYTSAEMREIDRHWIEEIGIPGAVLMNNAGAAIFREVDRGPVGIVCGKGNNGGDGFVVARLAMIAGFETRVVLLADPSEVRGDARVFLDVFQRLGGEIRYAVDAAAASEAVTSLHDCQLLVDAILGTGTQGAVREPMRSAIAAWPPVRTIAVDLPSGLDADTGVPGACCIRADITVTLHARKRGFETPAAAACLGRVIVADIGIPKTGDSNQF